MKIHFIGIGGIGMSALARYFLSRGEEVSGSDAAESEILEELRKIGVKISYGISSREGKNPPQPPFLKGGVDLVIYSAAVQEDNPELVEARKRGIKTQKYAEALGEITKEKFTIAVCGTHGKSTTTAMVGLILEKAGLDPTVIVGTKIKEWNGSNFRAGQSPSAKLGVNDYLVIEADEYDRSFLNYWPKMIVLTNIEEDHLDTYSGGLPDIMETFGQFISRLPEDGALIANKENENAMQIAEKAECKKIFYSSSEAKRVEKFDGLVLNSAPQNAGLRSNNKNLLNLKVPGKYNISNAIAAITLARALGIKDEISIEALNNFSGAWRRMEYKGEINGAKIFDDYGHHPTEIKATLEGAREMLFGYCEAEGRSNPEDGGKITGSPRPVRCGARDDIGRLWCVFQPHQYHRTYDLFDKFVGAFGAADKVILLPIYSVAGREDEEIKKQVNSEKLAQSLSANRVSPAVYLDNFDKTEEYLRKNLQPGDICVIMGAGDVYKITQKLFQ